MKWVYYILLLLIATSLQAYGQSYNFHWQTGSVLIFCYPLLNVDGLDNTEDSFYTIYAIALYQFTLETHDSGGGLSISPFGIITDSFFIEYGNSYIQLLPIQLFLSMHIIDTMQIRISFYGSLVLNNEFQFNNYFASINLCLTFVSPVDINMYSTVNAITIGYDLMKKTMCIGFDIDIALALALVFGYE